MLGGEDMNYTEQGDERPFVTKKVIETVKELAPISMAIASFMASHTLTLTRDPSTNKPVTITSEKSNAE